MAQPDAKPAFAYYQDLLDARLREQVAAFGSGGVWAQTPEVHIVDPATAADQYRRLRALVDTHGEAAVGAAFGAVIGGMAEVVVAAAAHAGAPSDAAMSLEADRNSGTGDYQIAVEVVDPTTGVISESALYVQVEDGGYFVGEGDKAKFVAPLLTGPESGYPLGTVAFRPLDRLMDYQIGPLLSPREVQ